METVRERVVELLGDSLQKVRMAFPNSIDDKTTQVTLQFTDQDNKANFVSPAAIGTLLNENFNSQGLTRSTFSLDRPSERSKESEERFSELVLRLNEPVPAATLKSILEKTQQQLAASPIPERLENFDKQLAASTQERALYAIVASWIAMLLYLWFRFGNWTFGLAAVLCLMHDLFFTLGIVSACHYIHGTTLGNILGIGDFKIDLPAIASLLTLVGYSVNDTIVVFDRIREVRGKNPALTIKIINDSINQTLTRTLLASTTVMLVVGVLYVFGGEGVKLFSFIMIIGVFVGTYSSIYIASPLLLLLGEGQIPGLKTDERPVQTTGVTKS
jgi:preprotein translocase SecF subunit